MSNNYQLTIGEVSVPVKLILERRKGPRAAFGSKHIILRVPKSSSVRRIEEYKQWVHQWLHKLYQKKPALFQRYNVPSYRDGQVVHTSRKDYIVQIAFAERKTISVKVEGDWLHVLIPQKSKSAEFDFGRLIANAISRDQHTYVEARVGSINKQYFNAKLSSVSLKYMTSRWGSCSSRNSISISSRLLKAPIQILDHVIIHELAHTKEMNHSSRFWNWVEKADPNFQRHDHWIKENGHLLYF